MPTSHDRASRHRTGFLRLFIEALEDRRLLAAVTLNPGTIFQTIQGWGTAAVYPNDQVTIAQAGAIMRDAGMNVVRVTPGPSDYTYTVGGNMRTPVPISANLDENVARFYPGGNSQTDLIQWLEANALEPDRVRMIGALWSPPHWMKITTGRLMNWDNGGPQSGYDPIIPWGDYGGNTGGGRVNPTMWTDWARYVLSTVKVFEQRTGLPMYAFSFQNEPNVPATYNSCTFPYIAKDVNNPSAGFTDGHWELYGDGLQALANELALHPEITTKFFGPELSQLGGPANNPYNLGNYNAVRQNLIDRGLLQYLGGYATHEYTLAREDDAVLWDAWYNGSAHAANIISGGTSNWLGYLGPTPGIAGDNKEIWQTETEGEDQTWTKDGAMAFGLKIYNALVYGNVSGYTTWTLTGYNSSDSWGLVDLDDVNNPTNSYKYDAFKQFSRWIRPGAQRISATFENGKASIGGANELDTYNGLNVSAFTHAQDEQLTMVFVNMQAAGQSTTIIIPAGLNIASFQVYQTTGTQKYVQLSDLTPSNGLISLTVPASSIVTITGSYAGAPVNHPPTVATAASATPNPITGGSTALSVLGADNGGEANLTYTWATTGTPPAPVTFSINGTNAAKSTTATFTKAGTYSFTVTIRDADGLWVTSSVDVTVNLTITGNPLAPAVTWKDLGKKRYDLVIHYSSSLVLDTGSIDGDEIQVTGPTGLLPVSLLGISVASNGKSLDATYRLTPPGGSWSPEDNGSYTIALLPGSVADVANNSNAAANLGPIPVSLPGPGATALVVPGTPNADVLSVTLTATGYSVGINGMSLSYAGSTIRSITVNGLAGNDRITLTGEIYICEVSAGAGNDTIQGGSGDDLIRGDEDNDVITGNLGEDTLYGNFGNDSITGDDGADSIMGGLGADTLDGGLLNDSLYGGDQTDLIYGREGNDYIEGRGKADTIYGGAGNDTILGGAGSDQIYAEDGDDRIYVGLSLVFADTVDGGAGHDTSDKDANDLLSNVENVLA